MNNLAFALPRHPQAAPVHWAIPGASEPVPTWERVRRALAASSEPLAMRDLRRLLPDVPGDHLSWAVKTRAHLLVRTGANHRLYRYTLKP